MASHSLVPVTQLTNYSSDEESVLSSPRSDVLTYVDEVLSGSSSSSPKALQIIPEQMVAADEYYAWFYDGPQWMNYLMGIGLVVCMFGGVLFPLWPPSLRLGVYYLSMGALGLLGLFFAIAIVRLIFYIITIIVASPGIWIFPKLFADVGFVSRI